MKELLSNKKVSFKLIEQTLFLNLAVYKQKYKNLCNM